MTFQSKTCVMNGPCNNIAIIIYLDHMFREGYYYNIYTNMTLTYRTIWVLIAYKKCEIIPMGNPSSFGVICADFLD